MKASAIIRICIWSLVAIILIAILAFGLIFRHIDLSFNWGGYHFSDEDSYSIGETTLSAENIYSLDIEWISGSIRIIPTSEEQIIIRESKVGNTANELRWRVHNGELQIRYCKPKWFGNTVKSKDLEILLPATMLLSNPMEELSIENVSSTIDIQTMRVDHVNIESVSGSITIKGSNIATLDLENVSGHIDIEECEIGNLELSTVSGNVNSDGIVHNVDVEGVSAKISIRSIVCPQRVSVESISGSVELTIPEDSDFTIHLDGLSTALSAADFALTAKGNGIYSCGDGTARFEMETMSGHLHIWKISPDQ